MTSPLHRRIARSCCPLFIALVGLFSSWSSAAQAQATSLAAGPGEEEPRFQPPLLVVDPAAEPIPALKYHLLTPPEAELPGNAAVIYDRIVHERDDKWRDNLGTETDRFLQLPREKFALDEAKKLLETYRDATDELAAAARRANCDWEYALELTDPLYLRLADAQYSRQYARLLGMKVRYEVFSDNLPGAIGSLRDGLELGQHVGSGPFLISQLIGYSISSAMLAQYDTLVQAPAAPNLYWALGELPRPVISFRQGGASEINLLETKFPALAHLDDPDLTPNWQRLAREIRRWLQDVVAQSAGVPTDEAPVAVDEATDEQLAMARDYLRDTHQRSAEAVKAMSPAEVEVRYSVALFREIGDNWRKWFLVPAWQSLPDAVKRREALLAEAKRREILPLSTTLTPIEANLLLTPARLDRQVARLQTIEALRMHAAAAGRLPTSLNEVKVVPVPLDPGTGQPFVYKLEGDVATLDAVETDEAERESLRVPTRIQLRAK